MSRKRFSVCGCAVLVALVATHAIASPPSNDDCTNAVDVVLGTPLTASNVGATDSGVTRCAASDDKDVWFYIRGGGNLMNVSTCGSDFDTTVSVFKGCPGPQVACSDVALTCSDVNAAELSGVPLTIAQDYFIRVAGVGSATGNIALLVTAVTPPPPANDDCANAIPVFDNVEVFGTNVGATDSGVVSCTGDDPNDVWYLYLAPATQKVNIALCDSDFDTTVSVFDGCGGTQLACNDQSTCGDGNQSFLPCFQVQAGSPYLLRVAGWQSDQGNIALLVTPDACTPPANDDCANAIVVEEETPVTGNNHGATDSAAPQCVGNDPNDVWYLFRPLADHAVTISLCASDFDTTLSVIDGCGGAQLDCNDDSDACVNPSASQIDCLPVQGGHDYLIRVAGYDFAEGNYSLLITSCGPQFSNITATPPEAGAGEDVDITFTASADLVGDPEVTVNGHPTVHTAKLAFTFTYTVLPSDPDGPALIEVSGVDGTGNVGLASSLTALSIGAHVPVLAWPAVGALVAAGALALRRRK